MHVNCNYHPQALANGTPIALPRDGNRSYLCIVPTAATTVEFTENGVTFSLAVGQVWSPYPVPINPIKITGTGTVITG